MKKMKTIQKIINRKHLNMELTIYEDGQSNITMSGGQTGSVSVYIPLSKDETILLYDILAKFMEED